MALKDRIKNDPKSRRKRHLLLLVFLVVVAILVFSDYGLVKRIELSSDLSETEEKIEEAYYVQDSLKKLIEDVETDIFTIEKVAREEYGMIKPGEKVFILDSTEIRKD